MKKIFCIMSLVFGLLCLVCGAIYGGLLVWELIAKMRCAKETAFAKIREFVAED